MSKLIFLIFFPIYLISGTLTLNLARDNNVTFSVCHIDDTQPFLCKEVLNDLFKKELLCTLSQPITGRTAPLENRFFKIYFKGKSVRIVPKYHCHFYPYSDTFIDDQNVSTSMKQGSLHWMIVGFKKRTRLFAKENSNGLDFPITFEHNEVPFIGELDYNLKPVTHKEYADEMERIRGAYRKKQYEEVLDRVERFEQGESNSFIPLAKLYELRAWDKMIETNEAKKLDPMEWVEKSKAWIEENPSSEYLAEVYSFVAKGYIKMGRYKEAKGYMKILKDDFSNSSYFFQVKLFEAKRYEQLKKFTKAITSYRQVLYHTQDVNLASLAALHLTKLYLAKSEYEKAKNLILKVQKANPPILVEQIDFTLSLAEQFADNNESNLSLSLLPVLEKSTKIDNDRMTKDKAYWYEKAGESDKAISIYRYYLEKYADGKYVDFVKEHLDLLALDSSEQNQSKRLAKLNDLMKRYQGKELWKKALLEKSKILVDQKAYEEILKMKNDLQKAGGEKLVQLSAQKLFERDLQNQKCKEAVGLLNDYNITTPDTLKEKLFLCYKQQKDFKRAIREAKTLLKDQNLTKKSQYLYELIQLYAQTGNDKALLLVANDLEKVLKITKEKRYEDYCLKSVPAYAHLKKYEDLMLQEAQKCEKRLGDDVRLLDIYHYIVLYAKSHHLAPMAISYTTKMVTLQKRYHIDTYSPQVDIDLAEALRKEKEYQKALDALLPLLYKTLTDEEKAHVLYLAAYLSEKLGKIKEAKSFYTKCGEIVKNSAWVELCAENMALLE